MKKVLVIGGSGFLGSHTADELTRQGYRVAVFDRVKSPWLLPEQKMHVGDILDRTALQNAMKDADVVYHFAGVSDITDASNRPFDTINLNVIGTTTVLDAASQLKVKRKCQPDNMLHRMHF